MADFDKNCPLCTIPTEDSFRVVTENSKAYVGVPHAPLVEGHVMVLPKRHALLSNLDSEELACLQELIEKLKNKLINLYPKEPPMVYSVMDTQHASVPTHFHYHIIPVADNLRKIMARYYPKVQENEVLSDEELKRMADKLKKDLHLQ